MNDALLTRKHAMGILLANFPFLSPDESDMLLDLFGTLIETLHLLISHTLHDAQEALAR